MPDRDPAKKKALQARIKKATAKRGRPKGAWTPDKVRERIQIAQIALRLEKQALGKLDGFQLVERPMVKNGQVAKDRKGNAKTELVVRSTSMTPAQIAAASMLLDRCIPKAQAPLDIALNGNITVIRRDPTQRPAGYHRKGKASP
jgi:hypothetical protein